MRYRNYSILFRCIFFKKVLSLHKDDLELLTPVMEDVMALGWFFLGMFLGICFGIFAVSLLQMGAKRDALPCDTAEFHP